MLEGLDEKPWLTLSHAYGKAKNVPELLRELTSKLPKTRSHGIFMLGASICHQGTLYSATPIAIPFLIELAASTKVKDRAKILGLLANIASLDDHERFLLDGIPRPLPTKIPTYKRSLAAVNAGAETFAKLLSDKDAAVRSAAAFLLAWLPATEPATVRAALAKETDDLARASLVLALAYLDPKASFTKELAAKSQVVRTAAALAIHDDGARAILGEAAKKNLVVPGLPWHGGDLAHFAVRVLAAMKGTDAELVGAVEAGGTGAMFASNVVVRRLFEPLKKKPNPPDAGGRKDQEENRLLAAVTVKLGDLDPLQRRFMAALGKGDDDFNGDLETALAERGLPPKRALVKRYLDGSKPTATSILDRAVKTKTLADLYVDAIEGRGGVKPDVLAAIEAATTPDERVDLAAKGLENIDVKWSGAVALELFWRNAPKASKGAIAAIMPLEKKGHINSVAVGVALAAIALAAGKPAAPEVDAMLQKAYGFWPRVRDALAALPIARREAWLLHKERDDREQPAEYFTGAWQYWVSAPTTTIANRALAHVATWKKKDPWGGARKSFADPHLKSLIDALRSAGNEADAARCEAALAKLPA